MHWVPWHLITRVSQNTAQTIKIYSNGRKMQYCFARIDTVENFHKIFLLSKYNEPWHCCRCVSRTETIKIKIIYSFEWIRAHPSISQHLSSNESHQRSFQVNFRCIRNGVEQILIYKYVILGAFVLDMVACWYSLWRNCMLICIPCGQIIDNESFGKQDGYYIR